jgi:ketopantoate reductase
VKAAIMGAGSWGTTFGQVLCDAGTPSVVCCRRPELAQAINERHENPDYLPGITLTPELRAAADPAYALRGADLVIFAVPAQLLRENLRHWAALVPADAQLKMALFSDVGSLWANGASSVSNLSTLSPSQQIANSRAIRSSVGAGLIWDSMFGPIRVDYAYPIAKQSYDVTQRFQFSAGGF